MTKHIPNMLTFGRVVLTVIFLVMIVYLPKVDEAQQRDFLHLAFVLFLVAGLTDIIDGKLARHFNVTSKFGRIMDPLADKLLVVGAFICFAVMKLPESIFNLNETTMAVIRWGTAGVIIAREAYVTTIRHIAEAKGINFAATVSGKAKMFLQSFAIGTVIIKTADVQTATWGNCVAATVYILMIAATIISGIRATQRKSFKQLIEKPTASDD
ncbi:MAG: CDP-alcohol phosphatidyltransferase family protein [Phycisphaerae bacterium]|nr:CDP-alcohol phosphatidyltransferase family protein [Phycisphaerae bacterium]